MEILGIIVILILAYFNLKDDVKLQDIACFVAGSIITFMGFDMLNEPDMQFYHLGLILLGLIIMKPHCICNKG
jgi:hypothetical protein